MRPERRRKVQLEILLPGPGRLLSPLGGVVLVRGQGRSDRLLLVSPPRAQSSLLSPLRSSCPGLPASVHRTTQVTRKKVHSWEDSVVVVAVSLFHFLKKKIIFFIFSFFSFISFLHFFHS